MKKIISLALAFVFGLSFLMVLNPTTCDAKTKKELKVEEPEADDSSYMTEEGTAEEDMSEFGGGYESDEGASDTDMSEEGMEEPPAGDELPNE